MKLRFFATLVKENLLEKQLRGNATGVGVYEF